MHKLASGTLREEGDTTKFQKKNGWLRLIGHAPLVPTRIMKVVWYEKIVGSQRQGNFPGDGPHPRLPRRRLATRHFTTPCHVIQTLHRTTTPPWSYSQSRANAKVNQRNPLTVNVIITAQTPYHCGWAGLANSYFTPTLSVHPYHH